MERASTRYSPSQLQILIKYYEDNNKEPPTLENCKELANQLNSRNEGKPDLTASKLLNKFWSIHHETRDITQNDKYINALSNRKKSKSLILSDKDLNKMFEKYSKGKLKLDNSD